MSPERKRRHRIRRGKTQGYFYADCVRCGHVGGLFSSRDAATVQYEFHVRTGKSLANGEWL